MNRLNAAALDTLPQGVEQPRYDRSTLQPGIVHLGIGAFMRAHLAVATEAALHNQPDQRWGIVGVSLRQPDTRDALAPQDGLYSVAVCDADAAGQARQHLQVVGCIVRVLVAPENPSAVLQVIAAATTRIVSLTITEKGYHRDLVTGTLNQAHPDVLYDLTHPNAPCSAIGFVVHGLALRRAAGLGGVALLSLDNLPANGHTLHALVLKFAEQLGPSLAQWIQQTCSFPNSMVDRIVPRTTDADRQRVAAQLGVADAWPVMAEPFFDWAVEDQFVAGRPAWDRGGARFVEAAEPYETLKLRMVNGAHSTLAYLGAMAGWATVDQAIGQPTMRRFVEGLMRDEIAPTLPALPGLDLTDYAASLLTRFANPALAHHTQQIAMDGSQKLPQRWLGTVGDRLAAGQGVRHLGLAIAAWGHYLRRRDEHGHHYPLEDPLAAELVALAARLETATNAKARALALLGFAPVFGDLQGSEALVDSVASGLDALRDLGVTATLKRFDEV